MRFSSFEHTADAGIEVEADRPGELFEGAALGMFSLLADLGGVAGSVPVEVAIEGGDLVELMFGWLNELLYLADSRRMLFSRFEVREAGGRRLEATAWGEALDPGRHVLEAEVKAATYHDMKVGQESGLWKARVIFDT